MCSENTGRNSPGSGDTTQMIGGGFVSVVNLGVTDRGIALGVVLVCDLDIFLIKAIPINSLDLIFPYVVAENKKPIDRFTCLDVADERKTVAGFLK